MSVIQTTAEELLCPACLDEETETLVEPEMDNDLRYYECPTCGFAWGYEQLGQQTSDCQLGVPEDVRRAGSPPPKVGPPLIAGATLKIGPPS